MAGHTQRNPFLAAVILICTVLALCARFLHQGSAAGFVGVTKCKHSPQLSKMTRGAVDKAMKERIESVKKTGKLTDAMRLVAAAKVRRAQDGVTKSRPFSQELTGMIKGIVKKLKGTGMEAELPMLRVPEKVNNVAILVVTADRGLCGGYNSLTMKRAALRVEALNKEGIVPQILVVGKKAKSSFWYRVKDFKYNNTGKFFRMPDTITSKAAAEIGDEIRSLFLSGEVDKVEIVYAKFVNLLLNEPSVKTALPLSPTGIEDPDDQTFKLTSADGKLKVEKETAKATKAKNIEPDVIFDQSPDTILNSMLPLYLNSQILAVLFEAQASELSARMNAMKAATDNSNELVEKLTTIYNKKRQAAITQELCEISAGALGTESTESEAGPELGYFDNEDTVGPDFLKEIEDGSLADKPTMDDF